MELLGEKMSKVILEIKNLHVSVEGTKILKGVDLTIKSGEIHAIMGRNGAGKSTLAHVLMGHPAYKVTKGEIEYRGKPIDEYAPDFWLISEDGSTPIGYLTSPWYSPELETNIAMGYVPYEKKDIGNKLKFHLPDQYCDTPGTPVDGEIVEIPFRPSVNPNAREIAKEDGRDAAY